jgi:hypothetical protein
VHYGCNKRKQGVMDNIEREVKKLKNLIQNKNKTNEELEILAKENIQRQEILGSLTFALDDEKSFATNLLNKYLEESSLQSASEKDTLTHLIDLEVLLNRIKKQLNTEYDKANPAIPIVFIEQVTELTNQIMELKEKLGLLKEDENNDVSKTISDLLERFHKWINKPENRSNFECQCPKCEEIILIRRRLDKEKDEIKSHPWYIEGGILFNKEIFKDFELGKISENQVVRYLNVTSDYINWIRQNYPLNQDKSEEEKED